MKKTVQPLIMTSVGKQASKAPKSLQDAYEAFLSVADRSGYDVGVIASANDDQTRWAMAKRRHDMIGAVRTLNFVRAALQDGYRFDDDKGPAKLKALDTATAALEENTPLLTDLLAPPPLIQQE